MAISFNTSSNLPVGNRPYAVELADINNDGKTDAVVTNAQDGTVSVLFGDDMGSFAAPTALSVGSSYSPINVSLIDVDFDGDQDIVTTNFDFTDLGTTPSPDSDYSILYNNGNGTFSSPSTINIPTLPGGTVVTAISVADFNGDGYLDFAGGRLDDNNVYVFPGTPSGFGSPETYNIGSATRDVAIVDIDKDGDLDSILVQSGSSNVILQLRNADRSISDTKTLTAGLEPRGIIADDVDGDGDIDLVVANSDDDNVSVLLGDGTGNFAPAINYAAGDGARAVAAGFINSDNALDLLVVNELDNSVSVLLNNTPGDTFTGGSDNQTFHVDSTTDVIIGGTGTETVRSSVTYTLGENVDRLILSGDGDINGTGNNLNNNLTGNDGDNVLNALGGDDYIYGYGGDDTLLGGDGNDFLFGGSGIDSMVGGTGNDQYNVDDENDVVIENADEGNDTVRSSVTYTLGDNVERLILVGDANIDGTGNDLNNNITGNDGINHLNGGGGRDYIYGQGGDDTLIGGADNDFLFGGDGRNTFRFLSQNDGVDRISDFKAGTDTIQIVASGFTGLVAPSPIGPALSDTAFISGIGVNEATNEFQRFIYNSGSGALFFDADGNGAGGKVQIATLTNAANLTAGDIFLI